MFRRNQPSNTPSAIRLFGTRRSGQGLVAASVMRLIALPNVTMSGLARVVERDPLLARRVRDAARSRSNSQLRVRTTLDAVTMVGLREVERLAQEQVGRRRYANC